MKQLLFTFQTRLNGLYDKRRQTLPQEGNRSAPIVILLLAILTILAFYFVVTTNSLHDPKAYLEKRSRVVTKENLAFQMRSLESISCVKLQECSAIESDFEETRIQNIGILPQENRVLHLRTVLDDTELKGLKDFLTVGLVIPGLKYYEAMVLVNGSPNRTYFLNRRIVSVFEPAAFQTFQAITIDILLRPAPSQTTWFEPSSEISFLGTLWEVDQYEDYLAVSRAGKASLANVLIKVVLAVFVLLFFLIIDRSAEALGLALAVGFESVAIVLTQQWLFTEYLGPRMDLVLGEFFRQMAMVCHVYFILQISRLASKSIRGWLAGGIVLGLVMAALRYYTMTRLTHKDIALWDYWRATLDVLPLFILLLPLPTVAKLRLHWRVAALVVAWIASAFKLGGSLAPLIFTHESDVRNIVAGLSANAAYLFVLSTFFNISTLEERVKRQTEALAEKGLLERDLEIGQSVQKSLHVLPKLPDCIAFDFQYEPIHYVSGDTFIVRPSKSFNRISMMLVDVTGHGIQAALKASACHSLAMTTTERCDEEKAPIGKKLENYHRELTKYFQNLSSYDDCDLVASTSFELDYNTGEYTLFKSNYLAPIVVRNKVTATRDREKILRAAMGERVQHLGADSWSVSSLHSANQTLSSGVLTPGSFLILISDGFIDSSVTYFRMLRELRLSLARENHILDATRLKAIILKLNIFKDAVACDDRTLLILEWKNVQKQSSRRVA
jgi:hypothetical protein